MSDEFASFRELRGIGPAIEARLHAAGVHTWQALSDVLLAVHGIRGRTGDTLRELAELAVARAPSPDARGEGPDGAEERSESFLLRIALAAGGTPSRTSTTRVRTQTVRSHPGWSPDQVVRFVEEAVGLLDPGTSGDLDGCAAVVTAAPAEPDAAPERAPGPVREPVPEPINGRQRPELVKDLSAVLLLGTVIGGGDREYGARVVTRGLPAGGYEYEAVLLARPLGDPDPDPRNGTVLDRRVGQGRSPDPLELTFPAVAVPPGLQRLRLAVTVRLPAVVVRTPGLGLELLSAAPQAPVATAVR